MNIVLLIGSLLSAGGTWAHFGIASDDLIPTITGSELPADSKTTTLSTWYFVGAILIFNTIHLFFAAVPSLIPASSRPAMKVLAIEGSLLWLVYGFILAGTAYYREGLEVVLAAPAFAACLIIALVSMVGIARDSGDDPKKPKSS